MLSRPTYVLSEDAHAVERAVDVLRAGGLVILPTDTVYGVAVDPENPEAVRALYDAKGREEEKPLQVLVADASWLDRISCGLTSEARCLAAAFFPGGITLIVRRADSIAASVVAGGDTVGVRVPDHAVCLAIVRAFGRPLAASSANRSGQQSPRTAGEAMGQLDVDLVVDGGPCPVGRDSAVIDASGPVVRILREGAVVRADVERVLGRQVG